MAVKQVNLPSANGVLYTNEATNGASQSYIQTTDCDAKEALLDKNVNVQSAATEVLVKVQTHYDPLTDTTTRIEALPTGWARVEISNGTNGVLNSGSFHLALDPTGQIRGVGVPIKLPAVKRARASAH